VLAALADWAGAHEADRMYLQVERDNIPADPVRSGVGAAAGQAGHPDALQHRPKLR